MHDHGHGGGQRSRRALWWALAINFVFLIAEFVGGLLTGSLALLSDAGHMVTDVAALALAIVAAHLAMRPPTPKRTFGLLRAEVIGAFLNGVTLVLIVGLIFREAWHRIGRPADVLAGPMLAIAVLGLVANVASAAVLLPSRKHSLNIRGAFLHLAADALGSVGAIVAGVVILATGWTPIDAIASVVIGVLILLSSVGLLRETVGLLLDATPAGIDYDEVRRALEGVRHFQEVNDLHIWSVVPGLTILTAHVRLEPGCSDTTHWQQCLQEAQDLLGDRFGIEHSTLHLEAPGHVGDHRGI